MVKTPTVVSHPVQFENSVSYIGLESALGIPRFQMFIYSLMMKQNFVSLTKIVVPHCLRSMVPIQICERDITLVYQIVPGTKNS